jgi:16S rRNA (cytidine1402-2'-O)-methyltransferase
MTSPRRAPDTTLIADATMRDLARLLGEPLAPGLYVVATPIGNLADITLRALSVLARADIVYCEDTRHSVKLFQHFGISAVTRPLHDHNEADEEARLQALLAEGKRVAIISDAGTPLISDPGFRVVRAASAAGLPVFSIPGPSAAIAALACSGIATDTFCFAGFLPPKTAARRARLEVLRAYQSSLVFYEAPQRVGEALADMADVLGNRDAVVARELTKLHEERAVGRLATLAQDFLSRDVKGEIAIVVGPPIEQQATDQEIETRLEVALAEMSLKDAAKAVADALSVPKQRVYAIGLRLKAGG